VSAPTAVLADTAILDLARLVHPGARPTDDLGDILLACRPGLHIALTELAMRRMADILGPTDAHGDAQ